MLVPSEKLILRSALVLLPAALAAALAPQAAPVAGLVAVLFGVAVMGDAWRAAGRLDGLTAEVPEVTRLVCGRDGVVELTIAYSASLGGERLRVMLDADDAAGFDGTMRECLLPEGAEVVRLAWPCRPVRRGLYRLWMAGCETDSPWGFWNVARHQAVDGGLRIHPDLRRERRHIPAIFLQRGREGLHARRTLGKGREFDNLREYVAGDDPGDIHWKATARHNFPITKAFQSERTQEVCIVLDVSRLSGRTLDAADGSDESFGDPATPRTVLDQHVLTALALVMAAGRLGDRCGLIVFHRRVACYLPPGGGRQHIDACRNALYGLGTEPVSPDFRELFAFIRTRLRKRTLLLFLANLDSAALAEPFLEGARLVARQHLLAVPLLTAREVRPVFSGAEPQNLDDAWRDLAGHLQWQRLGELGRRLRACGAQTRLAPASRSTATLFSLYRRVKERQLL